MHTWLLVEINTTEWTWVQDLVCHPTLFSGWMYAIMITGYPKVCDIMMACVGGDNQYQTSVGGDNQYQTPFCHPCWMWTLVFVVIQLNPCKETCSTHPTARGWSPSPNSSIRWQVTKFLTVIQKRKVWSIWQHSQFSVVGDRSSHITHTIVQNPKSPLQDLGPFFYECFTYLGLGNSRQRSVVQIPSWAGD